MLRALPYVLFPVAIILIIVEETKEGRKDADLRHHAYNALGFWAGAMILSIPVWIVSWTPILGSIIVALYWITIIVLAIIFALRAYRDERVRVPVMTDFLKRNVKGF
jgi:uncharacterized membrane protein